MVSKFKFGKWLGSSIKKNKQLRTELKKKSDVQGSCMSVTYSTYEM